MRMMNYSLQLETEKKDKTKAAESPEVQEVSPKFEQVGKDTLKEDKIEITPKVDPKIDIEKIKGSKKKILGSWNEEESKSSKDSSAGLKGDNPFDFPSLDESRKMEKISPITKKEVYTAVKGLESEKRSDKQIINQSLDPNFPSLEESSVGTKPTLQTKTAPHKGANNKLTEEHKSTSSDKPKADPIINPSVKKNVEIPATNNSKTANPKYMEDFPAL